MPSTRWRTIKTLFNAAIELPMDRRADYLDRSCPDDVEIRNEVNSLLEHHAESSCFIEPPDIHSVARAFEGAEIRSRVGHRVGAYELIRLLDTGGMGHVYLAQRADGQFDKQVAIKVIRRSVDHEELRLRFINEQKALASLEHPNIARLLDGGITGDGLSYLVMEYVEGCPIDEYCDQHRLSTEKRLEIFRAVCAAVHYAHQRLVIHRDLKPANILVTADGAPKLLDFGIAKLLDSQEPVRPKAESGEDPPAFAARPKTGNLSIPFLTPEYASPEQIRGEPITTASDTYSLGVILYELLAGRRPFRFDSRAQHEIARQICAEEPIKPSTAVRQIPFSRSEGAASQSKCSPQTLKRRLAGDLDNICLMALRKEPERRYGSVEQFAEDVRRHLIGLPVIARKDTFSYRAAKFARRNRAAVIASSILFLALVGGIVGTSMTLLLVQRAQDKTLLMNDFLKQMIAEADVNSVGRDLTVRQMLDRASRRVAADFRDHPDVEAGLRAAIGNAYLGLQLPDAEPHLEAAYQIRKTIFREPHQDLADSLHDLAVMNYQKGDLAKAENLARQSLHMQEKLTGEINGRYASILDDLAVVVRTSGDLERAEPLYKRALALNRHLFGPSNSRTAQTLNNYAVLLKLRGELDRAETMYREAIEIDRRSGDNHHHLATAQNNLAALLHARGDYRNAEPLYREALDIQRRLLGNNHPATALTENNLAMLLLSLANYEEAEENFRHSIKSSRAHLGRKHPQYATATYNLGTLYQQIGKYNFAEPLYVQAHKIRLSAFGDQHPDVATSLHGLGSLAIDLGRFDDAERDLQAALALRRKLFPKDHCVTAATLDQLAKLELARNDLKKAEAYARESKLIRDRLLGDHHPDVAAAEARLGSILAANGEDDEARQLLNSALERLQRRFGASHPALMPALEDLGKMSAEKGDIITARKYLERAVTIGRHILGTAHPDVRRIRKLLEEIDSDPTPANRSTSQSASRFQGGGGRF